MRILYTRQQRDCQPPSGAKRALARSRLYPMVRVFPTRLNCLPIFTAKADDAALTLPISPPLPKSCAPCKVIFSGGFAPRKNSVTHNWAVFCSVVPQLTRLTLE